MSARPSARNRRFAGLNLARRPFVNRRPVARVSLLLAAAGVLLLALNLFLYVGYARTRSATASDLRDIETRIATERQALEDASATLAAADLEAQNELVRFLNGRIAERTFGWSVLFDRLAELLPGDVRLVSLAPRFLAAEETSGPRNPAADVPRERRVELNIRAEAKDGEEILELLDALFAHPAFLHPNLSSESLTQGNRVAFSLSVVYLPDRAETRGGGSAGDGGSGPVEAAAESGPADDAAAAGEEPS